MQKIPAMSAKDFIKALVKYGCQEISINGSHHKIRNPANDRITVIPVHGGRDIKKNLLLAILCQLGIDSDDLFS